MINDVINEAMLSYLMEHAVILKDPQDKVITVNALKMFMDCLNKKYRTEFYTKKEIDEKLKSCGGSVDLKELAERIPNFQYWLRIKQSPKQTVTATCDGKEYTADVLIEKGKTVTVTVKADAGYIAGTLSKTEFIITEDTEIAVTEATKSENLEAGSISFPPEYFENRNDFELEVPSKVRVLELKIPTRRRVGRTMTIEDAFKYFKVVPGTKMIWTGTLAQKMRLRNIHTINYMELANPIYLDKEFSFSWSKEINEHATDIDLTELATKWIIDNYTSQILVPDKVKVLKVEIGDKVKYVKLGEKRTLNVKFTNFGDARLTIENKDIFSRYDNATGEKCIVTWGNEIDTHTPDIEL